MFCFNEFAFTVQVKHKINSKQILGFIVICLYFTTGHLRACVHCKECSLFAFLILGSVFSDCVVLYVYKTFSRIWSRDFAHAQKLVRSLTQGHALFSQITLITFIVEPPKSSKVNRNMFLAATLVGWIGGDFEAPTPRPIRSWVMMSYNGSHWLPLKMRTRPLRMRRITWPVSRVSKTITYLESPTPICLFTMQLLLGYDDD